MEEHPSGLAPALSICHPRWDLAHSLEGYWAKLDCNQHSQVSNLQP